MPPPPPGPDRVKNAVRIVVESISIPKEAR